MSGWIIIVEDLAKLDLNDAYHWYETRKRGLGEDFLDEIEKAINLITQNPFYTSYYNETCRISSLKRFPYSLIYLVDEQKREVYIIAISHHHRKPGWFTER